MLFERTNCFKLNEEPLHSISNDKILDVFVDDN